MLQTPNPIMPCRNPFCLPDDLDQKLAQVVALWKSLRRAENKMPFGDDFKLSSLHPLRAKSFLLSAFAEPERFRFEFVHEGLRGTAGKFIDELSSDIHFSYLRAQSSGTVEAAEPTWLGLIDASGLHFSRVMLPMWGNGHVNMLLGATSH